MAKKKSKVKKLGKAPKKALHKLEEADVAVAEAAVPMARSPAVRAT